jgi:phosphate-selective porin OprO/OprP
MKWISTARLVLALGFACVASQAMAQQGATGQSFDELSARLAQQDQQIRQLQAQMSGMQQQGVNATPVAYDMAGAAPAAAPAADPKCAEVGSDMSIKARFYNGAGVMFESPNKDFTMHLGGWAQWDNVWWRQNANQIANIGTVNDGDYWRRLRIVMEGTFWETFEYRWNYALENNQYSQVGLDEMWVGMNKIPLIGTVRAGHVKIGNGLEGDMSSSSRCMTFMERSAYSHSIELNQPFGNGLLFFNTACDDRLMASASVFRPDNANSGDFFGTGQWGAQFRITGLPIYEDEGRHLLHLGISGGWRNGINSANGAGSADYVSMSASPDLNADNAANSPSVGTNVSGGTAQYLPEAGSPTMIKTGNIYCNQEFLLGTELLYVRGPLSLQAEYGWNFCNNAQLATTGTGSALKGSGPIENYVFNGGYLQAAYTLTGENRAYDKKTGTLSRYYLGGQGPYENAFIVRDEDGGLCTGHGALELACRYSYVDLNSGFGTNANHTYVNGGIENGVSLALNWYLNSNVTLMTDWVNDYRYDYSKTAGSVTGMGTELQISF